jgi:hypothetical protein
VNDVARGDRVRLDCCTDDRAITRPGTLRTVVFVDDLGTVHVRWDDGHQFGMPAPARDRITHVARPGHGAT